MVQGMLSGVSLPCLQIEVWDQDVRGRDEVIGKSSFSLLGVFKRGYVDTWVVIKRPGDDGKESQLLIESGGGEREGRRLLLIRDDR